jgi:hypothetical protein
MGSNPQIDYPRLIIADTDAAKPVFQDEEILSMYQIDQIFIFTPNGQGAVTTFSQSSYRRVAAGLLESLAANRARLANTLKVLDVEVDTRQAAKDLRETAKQLRDVDENSGAFAIVESCPDVFTTRERVNKMFQRLYGA